MDDIKHSVAEQHTIMKTVGDIAAASTVVATLMHWLPAVAAIFTIVWTGMRIYESLTGRNFSESWLAKRITGRE